MDPFNKTQADAVWQRVLDASGGPGADPRDPAPRVRNSAGNHGKVFPGPGSTGSYGKVPPGPGNAGQRGWAPAPQTAADGVGLLPLIQARRNGAAECLALSRRTSGRAAALLHRIYEENLSQADCLIGLYCLVQGKRPPLPPVGAPAQECFDGALRRLCLGEARCAAALAAAQGMPEYGGVFDALARQTGEHCRILLELLGKSSR